MTTIFGFPAPGGGEQVPGNQARRTVLQGLLAGSGIVGGGTVVISVIELLKSQPDKAFRLLETWGPWFFLAFFSVWAANGLMNRALDAAERLGDRVADSMDKMAVQQEQLAFSQAKLAVAAQESATAAQLTAARDNREADRMATTVDYAAQQSRETKDAVAGLAALMEKIGDRVEHLAGSKGQIG